MADTKDMSNEEFEKKVEEFVHNENMQTLEKGAKEEEEEEKGNGEKKEGNRRPPPQWEYDPYINDNISKVKEGIEKKFIRDQVWGYLEKNDLVNFPRPVWHRIPNFKGASHAAQKVATLEEFRNAKTIKVNPDKPQEEVRFKTLEAGKSLVVPEGQGNNAKEKDFFRQLTLTDSQCSRQLLRHCVNNRGIREYSVPVNLEAKMKVDLVVIGSVAVSKAGIRIGKGEGFADLEYAMMRVMNAIDEDTLVITTVHDCQVVDIPEELCGPHDVPVDIIVTPTQVIHCPKRSKPSGIIWSSISSQKLERVPVLKKLREREEEEGKDVTLKEDDAESAGGEGDATPQKPHIEKRRFISNYRRRFRRQRKPQSTHIMSENHSLFVGKLPRSLRVKDFKKLVRDRGVEPYKVSWFGRMGFAFLVFQSLEACEEALKTLEGLKYEDHEFLIDRSKRSRKHDSSDSLLSEPKESPPMTPVSHSSPGAHEEVIAVN